MELAYFPKEIKDLLLPVPSGRIVYECIGCKREFDISRLLYTCPDCGGVLMLYDKNFGSVIRAGGDRWRKVFDYRRMLNHRALKGIFRYYEFMAPIIPLEDIVYLGEGHTPLVEANVRLQAEVGMPFSFKYEGLNPSASFKDRGMACALSYINHLIRRENITDLLSICASTGDTSAAAALYASYLGDRVKSAVLLPKGRVTPQQLSQPLGNGARVLEIPGVFDDCMKIVEFLAEKYHVALLNSKNSWRILGQESFSFEVAQDFDYDLKGKVVVVPIGNAGNITAIMSGFLKFFAARVIADLPKIVGVQSEHADPVFRYYLQKDPSKRSFRPVRVRPSAAQAAMIGNPVSMPRVIKLVEQYNRGAGGEKVFVVRVKEQEIMDAMILANRNGHIACTQGGEAMAGLRAALKEGLVSSKEEAVLDSTAHALKFMEFQEKYFNNLFEPEFDIRPNPALKNGPIEVQPKHLAKTPLAQGPLTEEEMDQFVRKTAHEIAKLLELKERE